MMYLQACSMSIKQAHYEEAFAVNAVFIGKKTLLALPITQAGHTYSCCKASAIASKSLLTGCRWHSYTVLDRRSRRCCDVTHHPRSRNRHPMLMHYSIPSKLLWPSQSVWYMHYPIVTVAHYNLAAAAFPILHRSSSPTV